MADRTARRPKRSNGEGSIYETADGRFRGAVVATNPNTGAQVRRYVSGRSRADVSRRMDTLRRELEAGNVSGETTGEYLASWIVKAASELRPVTLRGYRQHITSHLAPLSAVPLSKLTPTHVEQAMAAMIAGGLSPQTALHARSTLRRALRDAQRDGIIGRNVASLARPPRMNETRELRPLTSAEANRLLDVTAGEPFGPAYSIALATGLRQGELLALRWQDVDLGTRQLVVRRAFTRTLEGGYVLGDPKTKKSRRTVMLSSLAVAAFGEERARQSARRQAAGTAWQDREGFVFTDTIGRPVSPYAISTAFRTTVRALGIPVRFHDLRHTAATLMLAQGVPLKVVSDTLGHSTIVVTANVYSHLTPELRREAADAMDRALGNAS